MPDVSAPPEGRDLRGLALAHGAAVPKDGAWHIPLNRLCQIKARQMPVKALTLLRGQENFILFAVSWVGKPVVIAQQIRLDLLAEEIFGCDGKKQFSQQLLSEIVARICYILFVRTFLMRAYGGAR